MTIKCYDFLECKEFDCAMFKEGEQRNCWEVDPALTSCVNRIAGGIAPEKKIIYCKTCFYYKHMHSLKKNMPRKSEEKPLKPCDWLYTP